MYDVRVLAIDIKREAFDYLVSRAVSSVYQEELYQSKEEWKSLLHSSDIRVQWNPERDIYGNPLPYRSLQLGLKGDAVKKYVNEWIVNITDITAFVTQLKKKLDMGEDISALLPKEKRYY